MQDPMRTNSCKRLLLLVATIGAGLVLATPVAAQDPGVPGPLAVTSTEYNYGDSAFAPAGWPGPVEVRASVHYPTTLAGGPFPLVVFIHGRHATCHNGVSAFLQWPCSAGRTTIPSFQGYAYTSSVLASHGYIVVSISANGINAVDNSVFDLGAQGRAELIQHHLDIWNTFNTSGAAPFGSLFVGKVDLNNVGTMGHSRGGEGVMRHFLYNQSLGSPYTIRAIFPLAPVDFNRPIINTVPFEVLLPYCDGDVSDLQGVHFYDDARYSMPGDVEPKHYVLVMGANHNFYNTVWTSGFPGSGDDWGTRGDPVCDFGSAGRLSASRQRGTGLAYMTGFFRLYLGGDTQFAPMLKGDVPPPPSATTSDIFPSYHAPDSATDRRDVNRLLVASHLTTNHLGGAVTRSGFTPYDLCGGELPQPQHCLPTQSTSRQPHTTPSARSAARGLSQLRGGWTAVSANYTNNLPAGARDVSGFQVFQFRAGVNFEDSRNPLGADQDLTVRLTDGTGATADVIVSSIANGLRYPPGLASAVPKVVLNTIRLPLSAFGGVNLADIRSVQFRFDQTASGALLISDLAFADQGTTPGLADLIETAVSNPPSTVAPGGSFSVTDTARNQGSAGAGASTTRYHLSLDTTKGAGDVLLTGTRAVPALAAGNSSTGTVTVTVPGATAPNTYFLLACADDLGVVTESAEGNNCIASATTVQVQGTTGSPDLVVTALSNPPSTRAVGGVFSVTETTANQGASATVVKTHTRYYFSTDTVRGAGDKRLKGTHVVPILAAGASHTKTRNVTIPLSTQPGTYFLIACSDDRLLVSESNETNNCRASTTQITVTP
jgi:hypothetical protein